MDIYWLGHSCFRIKGKQVTIVTDPYPPDLGYKADKLAADIVTVSHQHPSHSYIQGVEGTPRVVKGPGEYEIKGVLIMGTPTFHDAEKGARLGKNTIYLIEVDGLSLCHLGDIGHPLSAEQAEIIDNVDVLMLPVGGISTIDAAAAAKIIRQIDPKVVLPMHYKTPVVKRELAPVDSFLKEMGVEQVASQPKLTVTPNNLPDTTKVFLLDY